VDDKNNDPHQKLEPHLPEFCGGFLRRLFGATIFVSAAINIAGAGPFKDAIAAEKRGDYTTAIKLLRPLAESGDVVAQFNVGVSYANGFGVPKNELEALKWFRKAAERGYAIAQNRLGNISNLSKQYADAAAWYRKAADQGHAPAQTSLGLLYEGGLGLPQDYVEALKWYSLAASQSTDPKQRDFAVKNYNAAALNMTPTQIAEAKKLAQIWRPVLDQAGGADLSLEHDRSAFEKEGTEACLKEQLSAPENASFATETLRAYCGCTAKALAELLTKDEVASLSASSLPASVKRKQQFAGDHCRTATLGRQ
jgi:TPR repeat protein